MPTLTPMSGCCYCSSLLRTALCLPGTFSLVQRRGQLAGSVCMCVHLGVCVCVLYTGMHLWEFISLVSTQCTVAHVCLCIVYIGVCVCQLARSHVWAESEDSSSVTTMLLTDGLARALLGAHCYEKRRAWTAKPGLKTQTSLTVLPLCVCVNGLCLRSRQCLAGSGGRLV